AAHDDSEDFTFYGFKFNSLMYQDSNFVGLQLVVQFAFLLGLARHRVRIPRTWYVWTFLLIVLTLSRASMLTAAGLVAIDLYRRFARSVVLKFLLMVASAGAVAFAFYLVQNDISFGTKFDILKRFAHYLSGAHLSDLLFGV